VTLSRKHYEEIAAIIRKRTATITWNCLDGGEMEQVRQIAEDLAEYFRDDNPRFRRALFMGACGITEGRPWATSA
jgi:hypothetical protein